MPTDNCHTFNLFLCLCRPCFQGDFLSFQLFYHSDLLFQGFLGNIEFLGEGLYLRYLLSKLIFQFCQLVALGNIFSLFLKISKLKFDVQFISENLTVSPVNENIQLLVCHIILNIHFDRCLC